MTRIQFSIFLVVFSLLQLGFLYFVSNNNAMDVHSHQSVTDNSMYNDPQKNHQQFTTDLTSDINSQAQILDNAHLNDSDLNLISELIDSHLSQFKESLTELVSNQSISPQYNSQATVYKKQKVADLTTEQIEAQAESYQVSSQLVGEIIASGQLTKDDNLSLSDSMSGLSKEQYFEITETIMTAINDQSLKIDGFVPEL